MRKGAQHSRLICARERTLTHTFLLPIKLSPLSFCGKKMLIAVVYPHQKTSRNTDTKCLVEQDAFKQLALWLKHHTLQCNWTVETLSGTNPSRRSEVPTEWGHRHLQSCQRTSHSERRLPMSIRNTVRWATVDCEKLLREDIRGSYRGLDMGFVTKIRMSTTWIR